MPVALGMFARWWSAWFRPISLGRSGEKLAGKFLAQLGYKILRRGEKNPIGEIDLICRLDNLIVFVEVKTRQSNLHGEPWQAVGKTKQSKIAKAALVFLKQHKLQDREVRFDVVGITWPTSARNSGKPTIEHFPGAFDAPSQWFY